MSDSRTAEISVELLLQAITVAGEAAIRAERSGDEKSVKFARNVCRELMDLRGKLR